MRTVPKRVQFEVFLPCLSLFIAIGARSRRHQPRRPSYPSRDQCKLLHLTGHKLNPVPLPLTIPLTNPSQPFAQALIRSLAPSAQSLHLSLRPKRHQWCRLPGSSGRWSFCSVRHKFYRALVPLFPPSSSCSPNPSRCCVCVCFFRMVVFFYPPLIHRPPPWRPPPAPPFLPAATVLAFAKAPHGMSSASSSSITMPHHALSYHGAKTNSPCPPATSSGILYDSASHNHACHVFPLCHPPPPGSDCHY